MKKIFVLLVAATGMLFLSCNSIDSQIAKYEKACKAGDLTKATEIASELSKHTSDFTAEQSQRILAAAMECANSTSDIDFGGSSSDLSSGTFSDDTPASSPKTAAEVDALISQLDNMLVRLSKMKVDSDEYDALADQIDNILDELDDCDLSASQESRILKLENRFDDIESALESAAEKAVRNATSGWGDDDDDDDDDWDF